MSSESWQFFRGLFLSSCCAHETSYALGTWSFCTGNIKISRGINPRAGHEPMPAQGLWPPCGRSICWHQTINPRVMGQMLRRCSEPTEQSPKSALWDGFQTKATGSHHVHRKQKTYKICFGTDLEGDQWDRNWITQACQIKLRYQNAWASMFHVTKFLELQQRPQPPARKTTRRLTQTQTQRTPFYLRAATDPGEAASQLLGLARWGQRDKNDSGTLRPTFAWRADEVAASLGSCSFNHLLLRGPKVWRHCHHQPTCGGNAVPKMPWPSCGNKTIEPSRCITVIGDHLRFLGVDDKLQRRNVCPSLALSLCGGPYIIITLSYSDRRGPYQQGSIKRKEPEHHAKKGPGLWSYWLANETDVE